jgi:hypothetical protein
MNSFAGSVSADENFYRSRIMPIVDRLMSERDVYQDELNKTEIVSFLTDMMKCLSPAEFAAVPDSTLKQRIRKLMTLEMVSGMLSDLSPEETEIFDKAVAGGSL